MLTSHGYHIPGTTVVAKEYYDPLPTCGGYLKGCATCVGEAYHATLIRISPEDKIRKVSFMDNLTDMQTKAKVLVGNYINERREDEAPEITLKEIHIVWFSKTLKNWKATVTTDLPDKIYYEITYDGRARASYIDVYNKVDNVSIPDKEA